VFYFLFKSLIGCNKDATSPVVFAVRANNSVACSIEQQCINANSVPKILWRGI